MTSAVTYISPGGPQLSTATVPNITSGVTLATFIMTPIPSTLPDGDALIFTLANGAPGTQTNAYSLYWNTNFFFGDNLSGTTGTVVANQWYFVAYTLNAAATAVTLYYCPVGSPSLISFAGTVGTTFAPTYFITGDTGFNDQQVGSQCGLKIWQTALTQEQLLRESECIEPYYKAGLFEFWPITNDFDWTGKNRSIYLANNYQFNMTPGVGPLIPEYQSFVKRGKQRFRSNPRSGAVKPTDAIFFGMT
jgi:hypothetical protein